MTPEIYLALKHGYQYGEIDSVYHFHTSAQYDGVNEDSGMFTAFIHKWIKLKLQASGVPKGIPTQEYVDLYSKQRNLQLDPNAFSYNPGLRQLAKLIVNGTW